MSSEPAISVQRIGKQYRYGAGPEGRLAEALQRGAARLVGGRGTRSRETFWALRDVSLEVRPGEVVGLIGRNGAGKSTLLKVLARITPPTVGRIAMRGRVASLLEVGAGFDPELSGRENIFLSGAVLGMRRDEILAKFDLIVDFSGIDPFIDTPVKRYSSGMFVRLAFAVGAHLESDILLVDEVLAVGDAEFQRRCLAKMDDVAHQGGRTILFVSHNMSAVRRLCDRAYLLDGGRIAASGRPSDVIAHHLREGGGSADGVATVPEDTARFGTGRALLLSATLLDSAGNVTGQLGLGEPFTVRLEYDVREAIPPSVVELGILTSDGLQVATAMSTDEARPATPLTAGRWIVDARLELGMMPGSFAVTAMLHEENGTTVDAVEALLPFTVSTASRDGTDAYPWPQVRGSVRPRSAFTTTPAAQLTAPVPR